MPTSSTAKLIAKRQKRQAEGQAGPGVQLQLTQSYYYPRRMRRPKSCKYDSYRLRSRYSHVEENLFGEPLKNKIILARSKSMEAIANNDNLENNLDPNGNFNAHSSQNQRDQQQQLFIRRRRLPNERPERPRTALATMRSGVSKDPEFVQGALSRSTPQENKPKQIQVISKDFVRNLIVRQNRDQSSFQPLILSRQEFQKILEASRILSPSERAALRQKQIEEAEALAKRETEEHRQQLEAVYVPAERMTEAEREDMERRQRILERAEIIKDESMHEVKQLNKVIAEAKCQAIRDLQINEKRKQLEDMAEADRHLEEEIEAERKKALQMAKERAKQLAEFQENYKLELKEQKELQEAMELFEIDRKKKEIEIRLENEEAQREEEARKREDKRKAMLEVKRQMMNELEEARRRKLESGQKLKEEEERILALQEERRRAEIAREEEEKERKKMAEIEKQRIIDKIEMSKKVKDRREEIRLARQQEEQDRQWREKELQKARENAERERELQAIRTEQVKQKKQELARFMQKEKDFWEQTKQEWQKANESETNAALNKMKKKRDYLAELQAQIEENHQKSKIKSSSAQSTTDSKSANQERLEKIRERKLQQLKAYNLPERYLKEIEKKCQQMARSRFTLSYFGKK